eukprot:1187554-Prorocentrum_minimum.AAC.2
MEDGTRWSVGRAQLAPPSKLAREGIPDMITLDVLSEAAIEDNVRQRYLQQKIYTYIGPILLSVNPYQLLNIYGKKTLAGYVNSVPSNHSEPHLYQASHFHPLHGRGRLGLKIVALVGTDGL